MRAWKTAGVPVWTGAVLAACLFACLPLAATATPAPNVALAQPPPASDVTAAGATVFLVESFEPTPEAPDHVVRFKVTTFGERSRVEKEPAPGNVATSVLIVQPERSVKIEYPARTASVVTRELGTAGFGPPGVAKFLASVQRVTRLAGRETGTETIDGRLCSIWHISAEDLQITSWLDRQTNSFIRVDVRDDKGAVKLRLRDIVTGLPPLQTLFEVPPDVRWQPEVPSMFRMPNH
ncbi:MAG: hypothetical protein H7338_22435 [Candidatus Sericytochromatia bacterium]|nr:hypothetical protein [Candidatus Sericytochromatia bacterium]